MGWGTPAQLRAMLRDTQTRLAPSTLAKGTPARPAPRTVSPPVPLEELFHAIQILATAHAWANQYTYNADGPDAGLHVILVRDVVLFAEVTLTPDALTPSQQAWLAGLRATGQVEVYTWSPSALPQIQARLSRAREEAC